ncbi:ABC transporter ATP-binding protein [Bowdeniella massiliensis]|uniref:ABC transporter ATP-binding protein n=1 Tax=Bowdeniella massiliensis TaxID=2932264 RepID=UPI002028F520|nr:ATP-binding cassette domain-containing protein [Bowdeniella massiliensis]
MLTVTDLAFSYTRNTPELYGGLSHSFPAGQFTALTGESGSGKSTLLYLLGLLLTPQRGTVILDGIDAAGLPDAERAKIRSAKIGFIFQDSELDAHRPIVESVMEPSLYAGHSRQAARSRAYELLEQFGLADQANSIPTRISGGQAQRAATARALMNDPLVVLGDEPTGNLDQMNSDRVLSALRRAARDGCVVVVATHDPRVVEVADCELRL